MDGLIQNLSWPDMVHEVTNMIGDDNSPTEMTALLEAELTSTDVTRTVEKFVPHRGVPFLTDLGMNIDKFVSPIVSALGVLTNVLTLAVMHRPSMLKKSSSVYFSALAIADILVLLQVFGYQWFRKNTTYGAEFWTSPEVCRYRLSYTFFSVGWSGWLTMAMTAERMVVTTFPLKAKMWCTRRRACVVVILLSVVMAAVYLVVIFGLETIDIQRCRANDQLVLFAMSMYGFVPVPCLFIMNGVLVYQVTRAKRRSAAMGSQATAKGASKITMTAITVSIVYMVLVVPALSIGYIIAHTDVYIGTETKFANRIALTLRNFNNATNFFLYLACLPKVRAEVREMFARCLCCSAASDVSGKPYVSSQCDTTLSETRAE